MARNLSNPSIMLVSLHILSILHVASATHPALASPSQHHHHLAKRSNDIFTSTPTHTTLCANYTTVNSTSPSSPSTSDCIDLLSFVSDKPGYWNISGWDGDGVFGGLVTNSTCQIALARVGNWSAIGSVGSGDIINVMKNMLSSSTGYCTNGLCAGAGNLLDCPGEQTPRLSWLIQRPQ